ncbi:hypothetical protein Tco_1104038 [Tanacetum coccineum]
MTSVSRGGSTRVTSPRVTDVVGSSLGQRNGYVHYDERCIRRSVWIKGVNVVWYLGYPLKLGELVLVVLRFMFYYKSFKRKRVVRWLRLEMVQKCDNVAEYKVMLSLEYGSVECTCRHFFVFKIGREVTLKVRAKQRKKYGHRGEKTNKHTKITCESNPKYIAKLAKIAVAEQAASIAAEQATRIDAAEQATNTS